MPMPFTDINRRTFLKGATGSMAALVVTSAYGRDTLAQETDPLLSGYTFLSPSEVPTVEALAEQIWPTTDESPGGRDVGVAFYIDRALSGAYREFQPVYRQGLDWVNQTAREEYGGNFTDLSEDQQLAFLEKYLGTPDIADTAAAGATPEGEPENLEVEGMPLPGDMATPAGGQGGGGSAGSIAAAGETGEGGETVIDAPMVAGGDPPEIANLEDFLDVMLTHTIEGLFADPAYGGNRDKAVWRALRYGGPYYVHTEEQQTSFEPLDIPVQSLADL